MPHCRKPLRHCPARTSERTAAYYRAQAAGAQTVFRIQSAPLPHALRACNASVFQDDFPLRLVADFYVMRNDDNRTAGIVEFSENVHDDKFVFFVEVSGRLIGE